ncbi:hypothetical protein AFL01nite_21460 [Aeromicrobium flavum]|uniref:Uncharacterized protein n=1 Tax=Aeromicrobium flavum TaxID=416568 RepID=A0A512HWJ7_9ACTN|nr:hypothetical protein [Aeromicrobium flavum]GEO89819.1 hypothetical protein AFL01nite_21460 [Aeromicrobium flavum]
MRAPIRPVRGRWPAALERVGPTRRFFRQDPLTILDETATPEAFREAMASIYVGGTIKITGAARHTGPDDLLIETVPLDGARIVDIGASDGSTSVDLVRRLPDFGEYVIADLFLTLRAVDVGRHTLLFDADGTCVLVGGRRLSAWPHLSRAVRGLYAPLIRRGRDRLVASGHEVLLLNPETRRLIAEDPRVTYRVHDVFAVWPGPQPQVIKIANLLRRLYFTDAQLGSALTSVRDSLPQGGHLMIVDNPRLAGVASPEPRAGIWRRDGARLIEVARLGEPEIADLVARVGASG